MKTILLLTLLLTIIPQSQPQVIVSDVSPVTVVSFKWHKHRQSLTYDSTGLVPQAAMIPQNRNFEKNRRANMPPGERDPNLDTLDGRSAAMERAVQDSRAPQPVDGFAYRTKVRNAGTKPIDIIFWEYQFREPSGKVLSRRQFLCVVAIKPEKDKELLAFSLSGPTEVVSVATLANKSDPGDGQVVINRVEYADGSIWQHKDWKFSEVRLSFARAVATPWGTEMCRGL